MERAITITRAIRVYSRHPMSLPCPRISIAKKWTEQFCSLCFALSFCFLCTVRLSGYLTFSPHRKIRKSRKTQKTRRGKWSGRRGKSKILKIRQNRISLKIPVDISLILGNLITVIVDYQIPHKPLKILSL